MDNPLVSIIIPVYNVEKYLAQCLESVLGQTYTNIEVICVNDGSTDKSKHILEEFASQDLRLKIINIENAGVSNARNIALSEVSGTEVMFVDADDWLERDCLSKLLSFNNGCCDILMFPYISERPKISLKRDLFDDSRAFSPEECRQLTRRMIGPIKEELASPMSLDSFGTVWGKLYKRSLLKDLEFVDLDLIGSAEDVLFNVFAFKKAKSIGYCKECYYHYRKNNESSLTSEFIPGLKDKWKLLFATMADVVSDEDEQMALLNRRALGVFGLSINAFQSREPKRQIAELLNDVDYNFPLRVLNFHHLPVYWKIFFYAAQKKWIIVVKEILRCVQFIRTHG